MTDYLVQRLYLEGRRIQRHERIAGETRGVLTIEPEKVKRRLALVARLHVSASDLPTIPSLLDLRLVGSRRPASS